MIVSGSKWLTRHAPRPDARLRLLCFHHSGGGVSTYAPWARQVREDVELVGVQLPGRENRFSESPLTEPSEVLARLVPHLHDEVPAPYVVFGHSMGGLLAFRFGEHLCASGAMPPPKRLIVSAAPAPSTAAWTSRSGAANLSDEDLIRRLQRYGGTPDALLSDPDFLAMILPALRADFMLAANLAATTESMAPSPFPLTIFRGLDDPASREQSAEAWGSCSTTPVSEHVFAGGHFYFRDRLADVIGALNTLLDSEIPH